MIVGKPPGLLLRGLAVFLSLAVLGGASLGLSRWLRTLSGEHPRVILSPRGPILRLPSTFAARGDTRRGRFLLDGSPPPEGAQPDAHTLSLSPGDLSPGLHELTWKQAFIGRRERTIAFGLMVGPFREAGAPVPCGLKVTVRQAALDTYAPKLAATVRARAAAVQGLPEIVASEARLTLVEGGLDAQAKLRFADGSELEAIVPLVISTKIDAPLQVALRGDIQAKVTGAVGALASLKGGGLLAALAEVVQHPEGGLDGALFAARRAGNEVVRREVQGALERWLLTFNETLRALVPSRLSTTLWGVQAAITLSPCGSPRSIPGRALLLRFGLRFAIASEQATPPAVAALLPGPVRREDDALGPAPSPGSAPIALSISRASLDALLDAAWRSGALTLLGANPEIVRRTNARLAGRVSFRLRSVELSLPPQLDFHEGGATLRAAETTLHLEERDAGPVDLVLFGEARLGATVRARRLQLFADATGVRGSCRRTSPEGEVREPCYPELIAALSAVLEHQGRLSHERPTALGLSEARLWVREVRFGPGGLDLGLGLAPAH